MKKIYLLLIISILVPSVYGTLECYQPIHNVSTSCGILFPGNISVPQPNDWEFCDTGLDYFYDGNSSTGCIVGADRNASFFVNYTNQSRGLSSLVVEVAGSNVATNTTSWSSNVTLPGYCYSSVIQLWVNSDREDGNARLNLSCHDGSGFQTVFMQTTQFSFSQLGLYFNMSDHHLVYFKDSLDNDITSGTFYTNLSSINYYSNPFKFDRSIVSLNQDYQVCLKESTHQDQCFDNTYSYLDTENYTVDLHELILNFTGSTTDFAIYDLNGLSKTGSSASSLVYNLSDFTLGPVTVYFNKVSDTNYSQQYQFINTRINTVTETLEVLTGIQFLETEMWVQVLDYANAPQFQAAVQVGQLNTTSSNTNFTIIHQVLTDSDGFVSVTVKPGFQGKLTVIKEGFTNLDYVFHMGFFDLFGLSKSNPLILRLSTDPLIDTSLLYSLPTYYLDPSQDLFGYALFRSGQTLTYQTSYSLSQGNTKSTAQSNIFTSGGYKIIDGSYQLQLISDIDFSSTSPDDITVSFFLDDTFLLNHTIEYLQVNQTNILDIESEQLDQNILLPLSFFLLIFFAIILQFIFHSESDNIGLHTFFAGGILLLLVSTSFSALAVIGVLYYILTLFRQFIGVPQ